MPSTSSWKSNLCQREQVSVEIPRGNEFEFLDDERGVTIAKTRQQIRGWGNEDPFVGYGRIFN